MKIEADRRCTLFESQEAGKHFTNHVLKFPNAYPEIPATVPRFYYRNSHKVRFDVFRRLKEYKTACEVKA